MMDIGCKGGECKTVARTAIFECRKPKKVQMLSSWYSREMSGAEPWDKYTLNEKVKINSPVLQEKLLEDKAQKRAKELGCGFKGFKESQDWLPRFMCEDVYGLQGGSAEKCKELFHSSSSKIADSKLVAKEGSFESALLGHKPVAEKRGFWSALGGFFYWFGKTFGSRSSKF